MGRYDDNRNMHFKEVEREGVVWIQVVQGRRQWRALANRVMNLRIPKKARNF
jgi:hypothetical protein